MRFTDYNEIASTPGIDAWAMTAHITAEHTILPVAPHYDERYATTRGAAVLLCDGVLYAEPRITFIAELGLFVMVSPVSLADDSRIAVATSADAEQWNHLGMIDIPDAVGLAQSDSHVAFFPAPVFSPSGEICLAMFHRPQVYGANGHGRYPQSATNCIVYIPLAPVKDDLSNLLNVSESALVAAANEEQKVFPVGAGTPPIATKDGWLEICQHSSGVALMLYDSDEPHRLIFQRDIPQCRRFEPAAVLERIDQVSEDGQLFEVYSGSEGTLWGQYSLTISFQ